MIKVSYENTTTGQSETVDLPDNDWIVLVSKSSDIAEAIWNSISSHNGIMRGFRVDELTNQAFDGLCDSPLLLAITDEQREQAHRAALKATLTFREYVSQALYALPEKRQDDARKLAQELGLLDD